MPVWKIEKDVPLTDPLSGVARFSRYKFAAMMPGDSHLELVGDAYAPDVQQRLCSAAWGFRRRRPEFKDWRFTTRISDQGVRIWRVK